MKPDMRDAIEAASGAASTAAKTSMFLSGAVVGTSPWTWHEASAIAGIFGMLATFLVTWYYRHKEFKLKERLAERSLLEGD